MNGKGQRGRPRLIVERVDVKLHFELHRGTDDDLIEFFRQMPRRQRPSLLKAALRAGGMTHPDAPSADENALDDLIDGLVL